MKKLHLCTLSLLGLTAALFILLSAPSTLADTDVVTSTAITIEESCTLSGITDTDHTADLVNGTYSGSTYSNGIGQTTLKTFCNDDAGYAIYAIGYTNDEYGNTTMHWDRAESLNDNTNAINTGVYVSGTTTSSTWSMKLASVSGTYAIIIDDGDSSNNNSTEDFTNWHVIPSEYKRVAYSTSGTDLNIDGSGIGSSITVTYDTFVSTAQPAGSYTGQVKYTLVHPNGAATPLTGDQVEVVYHGNGSTFTGGADTNSVIYGTYRIPVYMGTTPTISKTPNIANDGTMTTYYNSNTTEEDPVTIPGADSLYVELTYGYDENGGMEVYYYGDSSNGEYYDYFWSEDWQYDNEKTTSTSFEVEGDTVSFLTVRWGEPIVNYYGYYAKVYPLYYDETEGATHHHDEFGIEPQIGLYSQPSPWNEKWYVINNGNLTFLGNESDIIDYLDNNSSDVFGTTIDLYAYNPYTIYYDGNGATAGTMSGFYTTIDTNTQYSTADLMAYNFKKDGYGFAGWSENPNATVNSNSKIYGPNEAMTGDKLTFNSAHEATLYAVWVPTSGNMQNWSGCSTLSVGQVTALTDTRDNNVYTVGKFADENCWMMENLRLDAEHSSDSTKAQGFGGVFTGLADSEDDHFEYGDTTSNSKYSTSNITGSNQAHRIPRYNNNNTNIGGTNSAGTALIATPGAWNGTNGDRDAHNRDGNNNHSQWYGYGNYYNWSAAMANTTNFTTNYGTNGSENANTSICPNGWQLPLSDLSSSTGSFSYLDRMLGGTGGTEQYDSGTEEIVSNRWRKYPNNFVYSGRYMGYSAGSRGITGLYWSRTNNHSYATSAKQFSFHKSSIFFGSDYDKYYGNAVRCIKQ